MTPDAYLILALTAIAVHLIANLLSNACKYTDRGSVLLRTVWRDGALTLSVADTGRGISPEDVERILQPFVQVVDRNNRNGTGLGLSICQRLAQLMGGELKIESELGKGSTFSIVIPNVKIVERMSVPVPEAERLADTTVRRVMVVDDSSVNRLLLKAMLTRCGVEEVVVAENFMLADPNPPAEKAFYTVVTEAVGPTWANKPSGRRTDIML